MPEAMAQWNGTYEDFRYSESRNFDRDARNAYRRVTGQKFEWKCTSSKLSGLGMPFPKRQFLTATYAALLAR